MMQYQNGLPGNWPYTHQPAAAGSVQEVIMIASQRNENNRLMTNDSEQPQGNVSRVLL